ncbi:MAG TPA: hypothetical protein VIZ63_01200 [Povalibacter sp.]
MPGSNHDHSRSPGGLPSLAVAMVAMMLSAASFSAEAPPSSYAPVVPKEDFAATMQRMSATKAGTVEFFNLILETRLTAREKADLVVFLRTL